MTTKRKFQVVYGDGCNGWRLGGIVEGEVRADGRLITSDELDGEYEGVSHNRDGLYECTDSGILWVPLPKDGCEECDCGNKDCDED